MNGDLYPFCCRGLVSLNDLETWHHFPPAELNQADAAFALCQDPPFWGQYYLVQDEVWCASCMSGGESWERYGRGGAGRDQGHKREGKFCEVTETTRSPTNAPSLAAEGMPHWDVNSILQPLWALPAASWAVEINMCQSRLIFLLMHPHTSSLLS